MPVLTIAPEKFVKALWLQAGVIVAPGTEFSPDAPISAKVPDAEIQTLKELRFWP
jgi:aspartate/methionine/tyrosine aminotransferase